MNVWTGWMSTPSILLSIRPPTLKSGVVQTNRPKTVQPDLV